MTHDSAVSLCVLTLALRLRHFRGAAESSGGQPAEPVSLQTWHRTMSIDRDLAVGSVPSDASNPLPLPPRDRTKSLQVRAGHGYTGAVPTVSR